MNNTIPKLSVVVLCYRSEERIIPYLNQMEKELHEGGLDDYELVLVGNYFSGSGDKTPEIIRRLAADNSRIVPVIKEKQGMMGWDALSGLQAAGGEAIALIDGDGQMPSRDLVRIYNVLKSGEFDFVKTYRVKRLDGAWRRLISNIYNSLFYLLFLGIPFRDMNSKPKLITRKAFNEMRLSCPGWFFDGEMMLEVRRLNLSFAEIPTVFHENEWRKSYVKVWTIFEMIGSMFWHRIKYWFNIRP